MDPKLWTGRQLSCMQPPLKNWPPPRSAFVCQGGSQSDATLWRRCRDNGVVNDDQADWLIGAEPHRGERLELEVTRPRSDRDLDGLQALKALMAMAPVHQHHRSYGIQRWDAT